MTVLSAVLQGDTVRLTGPEVTPSSLKSMWGVEWNFKAERYEAPLALWPDVRRHVPGDFELQEDAWLVMALKKEETERAKLRKAAEERAVRFDAQLAARGLSLREYQREGIAWLSTLRSGLLTDQMGLGKTVQALCAIPEHIGTLILCPATLRHYWAAEVGRWRPDLTPVVLEGRRGFRYAFPNEVLVMSDATLPNPLQLKDWALSAPQYFIADEAHAYKGNSIRRDRLTALCDTIRAAQGWTIGLTGSPILNHPEELWNIARTFGCHRLGWGSKPGFDRSFAIVPTPYGTTYGAPKPDALRGLARISLRRTRAEVLPELPTKTYREIPVSLDRPTTFKLDAAARHLEPLLSHWENDNKLPEFEDFAAVRAAVATRKSLAALEFISSYVASDIPLVVFSAHRAGIDALGALKCWGKITGDVCAEDRTRLVEEFQAGRLAGMAGTIQAMGVGLTLTHAADVLFIDQMFTPALNLQAEDRVCRLGQTKPVTVTTLVADHPLERRIAAILKKKTALAEAVL